MMRTLPAVLAFALVVPALAQRADDPDDRGSWLCVATAAVAADELIDAWYDVETGRSALTSTQVTLAPSGPGGPLVPRELVTSWTSQDGALTHATTSRRGEEGVAAFVEEHRAAVAAALAVLEPDPAPRTADARIHRTAPRTKPSKAR